MKTPSDELFLLIKRLTSQEKRCFKLYVSANKPNSNFVTLFSLIDRMTAYNESKLKNSLNKAGGVKNLKQIKSQLYDKIVVALGIYNENHTSKRKIQNYLYYSDLLADKSLYKSSMRYLLKAEDLAKRHDQPNYLLIINSQKAYHARHQRNVDGKAVSVEKEVNAEKECMDAIQNTIEYRNIWLRLGNIYSIYADNLINTSLINEVKKISNTPLVKREELAITYTSKNYYHDIHHLICILTRNWTSFILQSQIDFVRYFELEPDLLISRASNYITALSRVITTLNKIHQSEKVEFYYIKASNFFMSLPIKMKTRGLSSYFTGVVLTNYMDTQLFLLKPEKVLSSWEKVKSEIREETLNYGSDIAIHMNLFQSNFYLGNYREALRNLNTVINFSKSNRLDIQVEARITTLLLHYELGNVDVFSTICRASKYFLQKKGYYNSFIEILVDFFETEIDTFRKKDTKRFVQLKKNLKTILKQKPELKKMLTNFDFLSWVESKIETRSFLSILKEKKQQFAKFK